MFICQNDLVHFARIADGDFADQGSLSAHVAGFDINHVSSGCHVLGQFELTNPPPIIIAPDFPAIDEKRVSIVTGDAHGCRVRNAC